MDKIWRNIFSSWIIIHCPYLFLSYSAYYCAMSNHLTEHTVILYRILYHVDRCWRTEGEGNHLPSLRVQHTLMEKGTHFTPPFLNCSPSLTYHWQLPTLASSLLVLLPLSTIHPHLPLTHSLSLSHCLYLTSISQFQPLTAQWSMINYQILKKNKIGGAKSKNAWGLDWMDFGSTTLPSIRSDPDLLLPNGSALRLLDWNDMAGPGVRLDW